MIRLQTQLKDFLIFQLLGEEEKVHVFHQSNLLYWLFIVLCSIKFYLSINFQNFQVVSRFIFYCFKCLTKMNFDAQQNTFEMISEKLSFQLSFSSKTHSFVTVSITKNFGMWKWVQSFNDFPRTWMSSHTSISRCFETKSSVKNSIGFTILLSTVIQNFQKLCFQNDELKFKVNSLKLCYILFNSDA